MGALTNRFTAAGILISKSIGGIKTSTVHKIMHVILRLARLEHGDDNEFQGQGTIDLRG